MGLNSAKDGTKKTRKSLAKKGIIQKRKKEERGFAKDFSPSYKTALQSRAGKAKIKLWSNNNSTSSMPNFAFYSGSMSKTTFASSMRARTKKPSCRRKMLTSNIISSKSR